MELITVSEYPLFIRKDITKKQAVELCNVLSTMRKGNPFLLAALDDRQDIRSDWQLKAVRNYYLMQPEPYTWKGDPKAWKAIFHDLKLELAD